MGFTKCVMHETTQGILKNNNLFKNIFDKVVKGHNDRLLVKLFSMNSLAVLFRSVFGLVSQKIIAIYLGPEGLALIGNLRNAIGLFSLGSTSGVDQGVLKYQAQFEENISAIKTLYSTALAYSVVGSIIMFLVLFFGASYWSAYLFGTAQFSYLFLILAFTLPFTAFYNLCLSVINGQSNYKKATIFSFTTYALVTTFVIIFVLFYQLPGALLAITLTPIAHIVSLLIFAKKEMTLFAGVGIKFHKFFSNKLFVFIVMAFAVVVLNNIVELQLRQYLIKKLSILEAGYWTSMLSLSNYYMSFMTAVYSLYILPKYSKMTSLADFKLELLRIYKIIIPVFGILFIGIYFFRVIIIKLLFTDDFTPMEGLFKWQLIGDLVKLIAVIIAYQFIAQKWWKVFIFTEVISYVLLYVLGLFFVNHMGVEGIVFAHTIRYLVYLGIVIFLARYIFKNNAIKDEDKHS